MTYNSVCSYDNKQAVGNVDFGSTCSSSGSDSSSGSGDCNFGSSSSSIRRKKLHWLPLPTRIHLKIIFLVYKAFMGLAPSYLCKLIKRPLSAISDRPLRSLVRNDLLVPKSRTSTSQQRAFASAGPLLWNCLPVKTCTQILSSSLSSTPRLLKSFLFPEAYRTGGRL